MAAITSMSRQATKKDLRPGTWVCSHSDEGGICDLYMIIGRRKGPNGGEVFGTSSGPHWMMYGEQRNAWDIWEWEKYLLDDDYYVIHEESDR